MTQSLRQIELKSQHHWNEAAIFVNAVWLSIQRLWIMFSDLKKYTAASYQKTIHLKNDPGYQPTTVPFIDES